jgi:hypothetical protein
MEVHHHPHLPHGEKKKFKDFFLEFLMIFLAVTLGFFAESLREHLVNYDKEREYMHSMLQDLKKDTTEIKHTIAFQQLIYRKIDSALNIPVEKLKNIEIQDTFYHYFVFPYSWIATFNRVDNTITQLKNAGGFSLINNKIVKDSITKLNSFYEGSFSADMHIYVSRWQRIDEFAMQLMILPKPPALITDSLYTAYPHHKEFFTRYDYPLLQQFYSFIRFEQSDLEIILFKDNQYLDEARNLIYLIKKEYKLKDE